MKKRYIPAFLEDLITVSFPQTCYYWWSIQRSLGTLENLTKIISEKIILNRNPGNDQMIYAEDAMSLGHALTQTPWEEKQHHQTVPVPGWQSLSHCEVELCCWPWRAPQKGFTRRRSAITHWQSSRDRALCNLRREEYCGMFTAQGNINRYFLCFSLFFVCQLFLKGSNQEIFIQLFNSRHSFFVY